MLLGKRRSIPQDPDQLGRAKADYKVHQVILYTPVTLIVHGLHNTHSTHSIHLFYQFLHPPPKRFTNTRYSLVVEERSSLNFDFKAGRREDLFFFIAIYIFETGSLKTSYFRSPQIMKFFG